MMPFKFCRDCEILVGRHLPHMDLGSAPGHCAFKRRFKHQMSASGIPVSPDLNASGAIAANAPARREHMARFVLRPDHKVILQRRDVVVWPVIAKSFSSTPSNSASSRRS
jgi:hypothetical protein